MLGKLIRLFPGGEAARPRVVTLAALAAAFFVTVFIVTEIVLAAAATVWALTGLLHLPLVAVIVLSVVVALPVLWGSVLTGVMAFMAETDPANK